jgi:hypothetical protein
LLTTGESITLYVPCLTLISQKPIFTQIIDEDWRREKFSDLDIVLPANTFNTKINIDNFDDGISWH